MFHSLCVVRNTEISQDMLCFSKIGLAFFPFDIGFPSHSPRYTVLWTSFEMKESKLTIFLNKNKTPEGYLTKCAEFGLGEFLLFYKQSLFAV